MQARIRALQIAESQVGVKEVGGNNRGPKVSEYQGADDVPGGGYAWCVSFVQWCFREAGFPLWTRTASVGQFLASARGRGLEVKRPFRGDLVCFQFTGDDWPDHLGFVKRVLSIRIAGCWLLRTVEGNTSSGSKGSQDDGGGVYYRTRLVRRSRVAFVRVPGTVR